MESQSADFVKVAQGSKVITEVSVNSTAVEPMADDKAEVLVRPDQDGESRVCVVSDKDLTADDKDIEATDVDTEVTDVETETADIDDDPSDDTGSDDAGTTKSSRRSIRTLVSAVLRAVALFGSAGWPGGCTSTSTAPTRRPTPRPLR